MHKSQLLSRIQSQQAVVAVVGLGYVGLPLAMEFAEAGFTVIGYDVSERVVSLLNSGQSHIQDIAAAQVAAHVASGRFIILYDSRNSSLTSSAAITRKCSSWFCRVVPSGCSRFACTRRLTAKNS